MLIIATSKELSWSSNLERHETMKQRYEANKDAAIPRLTPPDVHSQAVNRLPKNAERIERSGLVDSVRFYTRESIAEREAIYQSGINDIRL